MKIDTDKENALIAEYLRLGQPLPDRIKNAPTIELWEEFYLDAFYDLGSERQVGFGEGPIPSSAIRNYARYCEMDSTDQFEFAVIIRKLDEAYLKYQSAKLKKQNGNT